MGEESTSDIYEVSDTECCILYTIMVIYIAYILGSR